MGLVSRQEMVDDIGDRLPGIRQAMDGAWEKWQAAPAEFKLGLSRRCRSDLIHDWTVLEASGLLNDADVFDKSQLKLFVFDQRYALRFKKLDRDLHPRNQPSAQVAAFRSQRPIYGVPAIHNLEAGYVASGDGQKIESYHLVCPNGAGVYWSLELEATQAIFSPPDLFEDETDDSPAKFGRKKTDVIVPFKKKDEQ